MISFSTILLVSCGYFTFIYTLASLADKSYFPKKLFDHPITYALSLGAYAGVWVIFGATAQANQQGYTFIAYYFGTSILFIFAPLILKPIVNISQSQRLSSLADLFSYRYNSQWAGSIVALGILIVTLPLLSWQIHIINNAALLLSTQQITSPLFSQLPALLLCILCVAFAIHFGARRDKFHDRHNALVLVSAFQSLFKLLVFLLLGVVASFLLFSSPLQLEQWLAQQPTTLTVFTESLIDENARILILIFSVAALVMPHSYHLAITENRKPHTLQTASWLYPLYLLLLSLPVLPILWAGKAFGANEHIFIYSALIGELLQSPVLVVLAWLAALAAASGAMIVILIAVAPICSNHLILPFFTSVQKLSDVIRLQIIRAGIIVALVLVAFWLHLQYAHYDRFYYFYYASYIAIFQFLPGVLATLYWAKGNKKGLIAGLIAGLCCWFFSIIVPLALPQTLIPAYLFHYFTQLGDSYWILASIVSLVINTTIFVIISLITVNDEEEINAAKTCAQDKLELPNRYHLALQTVDDFIQKLGNAIGSEIAQREIHFALNKLNMQLDEKRPFALRLLRRQLEVNLSGLYGPTVARQIVNQHLPYIKGIANAGTHDMQLIEHRLEQHPLHLMGIAEQLDKLRRYHRNTLEQLPLGVCTISSSGEILMWNKAMQSLTGIARESVIGLKLKALNEPWQSLFTAFLQSENANLYNHPITIDEDNHWFNLHKANALNISSQLNNHTFLLEETTTRMQLEKELLHSERLASIGRLAAGVAHEIGNPVTGIACLAQNLKYDSDKPEVIQTAKDIITQTQRITRIVQSLVNFSHAGSHRQEFNPVPVRLFECANEAIHLLSLSKNALLHTICNNIDNTLIVSGDSQLLQQMFVNLISNALDVIDQQHGIITLSSHSDTQFIYLHIDDNGSGIDKEAQVQIFEPFFTTKEAGSGTGLGLALVYGIIEEHHGHISVQSPITETATGTRFIIQLPNASETVID